MLKMLGGMSENLRRASGRLLVYRSPDGLCTLETKDMLITKVTLNPELKGKPEAIEHAFTSAAQQMPALMDEQVGEVLQSIIQDIIKEADKKKN